MINREDIRAQLQSDEGAGEVHHESVLAATGATLGQLISVPALMNGTFSLFVVPLTQAFGWTRTEASLGQTIHALMMALTIPFAGALMDRWGIVRVTAPSIILLSAAFVMLAIQPGQIGWYYGCYLAIGYCAATTGLVPCSKLVSQWFTRWRGVALALTSLGYVAGIAILPQIMRALFAHGGTRLAYFGLAAWVLLGGVPAIVLMRQPAAATKAPGAADGRPQVKVSPKWLSWPFALCLVHAALMLFANTGVTMSAAALLSDRGLSIAIAAGFFSAIALGSALGRAGEGFFLDKVQSPKVIIPLVALTLIGVLLLHHSTLPGAAIVAAVFISAGVAGETAALPYFLSRYFGVAALGRVYGVTLSVGAIAAGLGPVAMARVYDVSGSYEAGLWAVEAAIVVVIVCLAFLPRYPREPLTANKKAPAIPSSVSQGT